VGGLDSCFESGADGGAWSLKGSGRGGWFDLGGGVAVVGGLWAAV